MYVGKAANLRSRLRAHRQTSRDLSRSTLRASVAVAELGVTRRHARARPSLMTEDEIGVVNEWFKNAEVAWLECATALQADLLERSLRAGWMPPLNIV